MRNLSKFKAKWKVVLQKGYRLSYNNQWIIKQGAVLDSVWGKFDKAKIKVRQLFDQLISPAQSSKTLQLQPIQNNKMKKSIYILAASAFMATAFLSSCDTPSQKAEMVQENVKDSVKTNQADEAYLTDMKNYRKGTVQRLAEYNKHILTFKTGMAIQKQDNRVDYQNRITALEQQSSAVKMKMDNFKEGGKEKWEAFKTELNQDMDVLSKALNDSSAVQAL